MFGFGWEELDAATAAVVLEWKISISMAVVLTAWSWKSMTYPVCEAWFGLLEEPLG